MKLQKTILILIILIASFHICIGQEKPPAVLIDEIGETSCEDIRARQDNFFVEISNNPDSVGYAIIYGKKNNFSFNIDTEKILIGHAEARRFDEGRFVIIRGKESDDLRIEFWKVPAGAEKPKFEEAEWDFTLPENKKPFVFNSSLWDISPCPIGNQLKIYSDFLKANPNTRGHIVIFAKSKTEFRKEKTGLSNELGNNYKILLNQIRFFFVNKETDYSYYEFWLVPRKKK